MRSIYTIRSISKTAGLVCLVVQLAACQQGAVKPQSAASVEVPSALTPIALSVKTAQQQLNLLLIKDNLLQFSYMPATQTFSWQAVNSPMVAPSAITQSYAHVQQATLAPNETIQVLSNGTLTVAIDSQSLCFAVYNSADVSSIPWAQLRSLPQGSLSQGQLCPTAQGDTGLALTQFHSLDDVLGLGQNFEIFPKAELQSPQAKMEDSASWLNFSTRYDLSEYGNVMARYFGGKAGYTQIPVAYYQTENAKDVGLFVDVPSKQNWTVGKETHIALPFTSQMNGFLFLGDDLAQLRAQYLDLTGHPPVPPKKMFGLWLSEYGFDNWQELDTKVDDLRHDQFPVEGAVLDLQWYGGIKNRRMGTLAWDTDNFANPKQKIADYRRAGLGLMAIEQSYVDEKTPDFAKLEEDGFFALEEEGGRSVFFASWWGEGSMLDWTQSDKAAQWHDQRRQNLIDDGIMAHWTDLGEPEDFDGNAWYHQAILGSQQHAQIHNLYNFLWSKSISDSYQRRGITQRPFSLARSGAAGSQRFGVAMWSGDVESSIDSLIGHYQAQTNMGMSGIDYYGSDIGGFVRNGIDDDTLNTLYTYWFANSSLFDVPIRPHVMNLDNQQQVAPNKVGDVAANLHNYLRRLQLTPYYYSLAHQAYRTGQALVAPMSYYFNDLPAAAARDFSGSHKMIGPFLLSRSLFELEGVDQLPSEEPLADQSVGMYVPKGTWYDSVAERFIQSEGDWQADVAAVHDHLIQLPLLVREGAIIPRYSAAQIQRAMQVLRLGALDYLNNHTDILQQPELLVVPSSHASEFTWYEDDGASTAYQQGDVLATVIRQQQNALAIEIEIAAAQGQLSFMPEQRNYHLTVKSPKPYAGKVLVNGTELALLSAESFTSAEQGVLNTSDGWLIKTGLQSIHNAVSIQIQR